MRPPRTRPLLIFLAGICSAVAVALISGSAARVSASNRYEDLGLFTSVLELVRSEYVEEVDERELIHGAVQGMLAVLDPHSAFMDEESYGEMQVETKGEFHGLGLEIMKSEAGYIEVIAPIDGTPASRAGIKARDLVTTICPGEKPEDWETPCRTTEEMPLFEAVNLMRGKRGTKITIEIFREGFERPRPFELVRDVVQVVSASASPLAPGYAHLRIRSFQERTLHDVIEALDTLQAAEPLAGLVLDLRDNPGGLLDQAVQVADLWLDDGLIVYTKGRVETQLQEFRAHPSGTQSSYPIVVLVNEGTASASEILAGALQDHHRALVLGRRTFGKGSVQTLYPLDGERGLRLTTALYYTPSGRSIQEVGIAPDIVLAAEAAGGGAADTVGRVVRERDLTGHFTHSEAAPDAEPAPETPAVVVAEGGTPAGSDPEVARALETLQSWTYFERLRAERAASAAPADGGVAPAATPDPAPGG